MSHTYEKEPTKMKTLLYDIESSPLVIYSWDIWETNAIKVINETQMLCFAYKWLGDSKVKVLGQDDFKGWKPGVNNDKKLVEALRELFDEADVVIAHNGNSFDQKYSQARMMVHGIAPPSPYKQIDTKLVARRYGRFTSNKLDDLGKNLSIGQKLDTGGFKLWEGCLAGDKASWRKMKAYNKQDVALLEEVYLKLRPWIANHPIIGDTDKCPKCGGGPMQKRGIKRQTTAVYQWYWCLNCHGWSKSPISIKGLERPQYV